MTPTATSSMAPDASTVGFLWPTDGHLALVQAALGDERTAPTAFRRWQAMVDLDGELPVAVVNLLPLVHHNLVRVGDSDALLPRLKGVARRAWVETQRLVHHTEPGVQALRAQDIPVRVVGGLAVARACYPSAALRPLGGVSLCVPRARVRDGMRALRALGWRPFEPPTADALRFRHALSWYGPDGGTMRLGWQPLFEAGCDGDIAREVDGAVLPWGDMQLSRPPLHALLLHVVVNGVRWRATPALQWIADAVMILRRGGAELEWDVLVADARRLRVTRRLAIGLDWLAVRVDAPVPPDVVRTLRAVRTSLTERIEAGAYLRDPAMGGTAPPSEPRRLLADLSRITDPSRPVGFLATLPAFLRYRWALGGRREIPRAIWRAARAEPGHLTVREVRCESR